VGQFAAQTAHGLAEFGHSVHIFSRVSLQPRAEGIQEHVLGDADETDLIGAVRAFTLTASTAFQAYIPPDENVVLLGCEWSAIPSLQILGALRHLPALLVLHSLERQRSDMSSMLSQQISAIEAEGIVQAKTVFARGAATVEFARRVAPDFAQKITALVDVFDAAPFRKALDAGAVKAKYQIGPVDPTVLFCGVLDENHGPDLLIKAVPAILKKHKQVHFVFVGDGPLFWMLRIYARYLGLDHAVRVTGHLAGEPLNELMQACDLVVSPSRAATEPWPILAGWSAGKAVLATKEMAGPLIDHEDNGVLLLPLPDSCAWGVGRVLDDPYLWGRIVENGRAKLNTQFGFDALARQIAAALQAL
jgi:glycosyltransferase involved in cell wall biosynthesis